MRGGIGRQITTAITIAVVIFAGSYFFTAWIVQHLGAKVVLLLDQIVFLQLIKSSGFVVSLPLPDPVIIIISILALTIISLSYLSLLIRSSKNSVGEGVNLPQPRLVSLKRPARQISAAFGLILGGATANLFFRLNFGFVWDYFNLQIFSLHGAWNLADLAVILGIVLGIIASRRI